MDKRSFSHHYIFQNGNFSQGLSERVRYFAERVLNVRSNQK